MPSSPALRTLAGSVLLGCLVFAFSAKDGAAQSSGSGIDLRRTDQGEPVGPAEVEAALARSGLLARVPDGEALQLYGRRLAATSDAAVFLGASSEYLMAAALDGQIVAGKLRADPGEVLVWPVAGGEPERHAFDVERFLASASPVIDGDLRAALEPVAERQKRLIFWGLLQPVSVNLQAPVPPVLEAMRRDYLLHPTVIALRQQADGDPEALAKAVAERFVDALANRESEAVESLLHPVLFEAAPQPVAEWPARRQRFAANLLSGPIPDRLAGARVEPSDDPALWRVRGEVPYRLQVSPLDGMLFVTALEPE